MIDYSRNWLFVDEITQRQMRDVTIGIAGCGMGSVVAEGLLRIGFQHFLLADGDLVEMSNLNRQNFVNSTVRRRTNKAIATKRRLLAIDPNVRVRTTTCFLKSASDMRRFIVASDYLLNTVDFDATTLLFNQIARELGKTVLFPFNVGFGSVLIVFTPESETLEEMMQLSRERDPQDIKIALVQAFLAQHARPYLLPHLASFQTEGHLWPYDPQIFPALSVGSALVTTALVRLVQKQPIKTAPSIIALDASMAMIL